MRKSFRSYRRGRQLAQQPSGWLLFFCDIYLRTLSCNLLLSRRQVIAGFKFRPLCRHLSFHLPTVVVSIVLEIILPFLAFSFVLDWMCICYFQQFLAYSKLIVKLKELIAFYLLERANSTSPSNPHLILDSCAKVLNSTFSVYHFLSCSFQLFHWTLEWVLKSHASINRLLRVLFSCQLKPSADSFVATLEPSFPFGFFRTLSI